MCYNVIMVKTNAGDKPGRPATKKDTVVGSKNKSPKTEKAPTQNQSRTDYSEIPKVETKKEQPKVVEKQPRRAMPAVLRVLVAILFLVVFAGIFTWYILLQQNMGEVEPTLNFIQNKPILAEYSYVVILLLMCVLAAATWRPFLTIGISFAIFSVLMYINTQKFEYRNAPLLPEDFMMIDQTGTLTQFIDVWAVIRLALGVVLVLLGSGIIEYGVRRIFGYDVFGKGAKHKAWWERHSVLPRLVWVTIATTSLLMFARPILHLDDKSDTTDYGWIKDLKIDRWNQKDDYESNGFIIGFLYNLSKFQESEPEGYSEEAIQMIASKYDKLVSDNSLPDLSDKVDNLIVVLNESFIDPEILGELYEHDGGDIVPELHKIFEKYPSGYMYSPLYGGGTANAEFEVLTGLTNYWAQTTPYVTSLPKLGSIPGLIGNTKGEGFESTAIHPFEGSMYKRDIVYRQMGVETFLDINSMRHTELENGMGYVSDSSAYNEALDVLNDGESSHMIMIATMQNHMPYGAAEYGLTHYALRGGATDPGFEAYAESVHHADAYLGDFVTELDKLKEHTVMLWFGDHAPAVLGDYTDSGDPELVDLAHLTPYFIYANFDLGELYSEKEVAKMNKEAGFEFETDGVDLPVTSPNCLSNTLYEILGVKKTPLIELLSRVCEETPILATPYSKNDAIKESETLQDYRLVNYDILSGKGYWLGS